MPTAYKGKIRITCGKEACPIDAARADVGSDCFGCANSRSDILDLEGRTIGTQVIPEIEQADPVPEIVPEINQTPATEQEPDEKQEKPAAKRLKLVKKEE